MIFDLTIGADETFGGGDGYGFDGSDTRSRASWSLPPANNTTELPKGSPLTLLKFAHNNSNTGTATNNWPQLSSQHTATRLSRMKRDSFPDSGTEFNDDRFDEDIDWNIRGRVPPKKPVSVAASIDIKKRIPATTNSRQQLSVSASTNKQHNNNDNGDGDADADYGGDDAWVHDGIDDVHIDPETKNAASEMSYDEKSIDAEYAPYQQRQQQNKTRLTTITEVIPILSDGVSGDPLEPDDVDEADPDADNSERHQDSTQLDSEHREPHTGQLVGPVVVASANGGHWPESSQQHLFPVAQQQHPHQQLPPQQQQQLLQQQPPQQQHPQQRQQLLNQQQQLLQQQQQQQLQKQQQQHQRQLQLQQNVGQVAMMQLGQQNRAPPLLVTYTQGATGHNSNNNNNYPPMAATTTTSTANVQLNPSGQNTISVRPIQQAGLTNQVNGVQPLIYSIETISYDQIK